MRMRLLAAVAATLVLAGGSAMAVVTPAHASTADETCVGTVSVSYDPGITYTPATTTFSVADSYDLCTGTDSTITSGADSESVTTTISCDAVQAALDLETIHWDNGNESVIAFGSLDVNTGIGVEIIVLNGTVISGEFAGDTVVQTNEFLVSDLLGCFNPEGLTSLSGATELEITSL
jgi:hypothetical protein